ncbi:hypothetical protein [Bradyrhizobium sp. UFLA03-84]|uniref:hypothetical protein n=1 Tax=Bradyrhizobium sp. UFLA03-84 TaxID=418599 RepID=UPI0011777FB3|nr:hypothetical protein [Bradyrhizobium sp. UFLA03-84]
MRNADFYAQVWVAVRLLRIRIFAETRKTPSILRVCNELSAQGGIHSLVGGNVEALADVAANATKKWHRFAIDSTRSALTPSAKGTIFSKHSVTNAHTLRTCYVDADEMVKRDRRLRLVWMNLCRQHLGMPPKNPRAIVTHSRTG